MSKRLFWALYVPTVLLGAAVFNTFDPPEPPATDLAGRFFEALGAGLVFAALGGALGFGLAWYRVRPGPIASIPRDRLRRDVFWITLVILGLMILYSAGQRAGNAGAA